MQKRNVVVIVGIETIRDGEGNVKKFSDTFLDDAQTYDTDHPKENVVILDARKFVKCASPMNAVMDRVIGEFGLAGIDSLLYFGHSDSSQLYVFSRTRTELDNNDRFITAETEWKNVKFNKDAKIYLYGCQTAGMEGKRLTECIAQTIADNSGVTTLGYTWKSSQKEINGKYYQLPWHGGFVECVSRKKGEEIGDDTGEETKRS